VLRLRPSYFPFTEPSAEVDVGYTVQNGRPRCSAAPTNGWSSSAPEWCTPNVIEACGLDLPEVWQGFAFGSGIDRLACSNTGWTTFAPSSTAIYAG
jgi:phenylalanyl-tRNA synthetase alpha chain